MAMWVLTRYQDVALVLHDQRFSADRTKWRGLQSRADDDAVRSMQTLDPPDHTRLRALVSKAFTPRVVEELRPRVQAIVDSVLTTVAQQGGVDLIEELAYPLPVAVIAEMLGIPHDDWPRFRKWSRILVDATDPISVQNRQLVEALPAARDSLHEYLKEIVTKRRREPRDDLISALLHVKDGSDRLTEHELLVMLNLLLIAGHETTVNLIGNGVLALLQNPESLSLLREQPQVIHTAVEELLRWDSPVQMTARVAREDGEVGGKLIRRGELLQLLLGAANRDPDHFPNAEQLDLCRRRNQHLAFSHGIHFCLGATLVRLEGQIAIGTLARRFPRLRLAGEPERSPTIALRGLRHLPVAV
jgi:cytochrome P450